MRWKIHALLAIVFLLNSCIGTDIVEGPEGTEKLEIAPKEDALLIGQTLLMTFEYTNPSGILEIIDPDFVSATPLIVEVDETGLVTALAKGKGKIYASFAGVKSDTAIINVVGSENDIAIVRVEGEESNIDIGAMTTLTANAFNINENTIPSDFVWTSLDSDIASVNSEGLVTGVARGFTDIIATSAGIDGIYSISVALNSVTATFQGTSGYVATGTAELSLVGGELTLKLSENFETSFALGTFVYLANSTNGASVKTNGLKLGEIKTNGSHTFNVSAIAEAMDKSATIGDYKYVIILCEPASLTFGFGELIF